MALNDRFRANMKRRIQKSKDKQEEFVKKLAIEIFAKIILESPVDKGRFRANWMVSLSKPNLTTNNLTDRDGKETENAGSYQITSMKLNGQTIYITNSLPYAASLEYGLYGTGEFATVKTTRDGYSVQAPYGMVRQTVAEFHEMAKNIGIELRTKKI